MNFKEAKNIVAKIENGEKITLFLQATKGGNICSVEITKCTFYDDKTVTFHYIDPVYGTPDSAFHKYLFSNEDCAGVRTPTNAKNKSYTLKIR